MRSRLTAVLAAGLLLALTAQPAAAHHAASGHWRHHQAGQLHVYVEDHATWRWTEGLNHAARQWSRSGYVTMRIVARCPASAEVCIPAYSYRRRDHALGWANTTGWPNQHYVKAHVKLNDYYVGGLSRAKRRYVVTHEIGHALGMHHSRYPRSVMYHGGAPQYPDAHDFATLRYRYAHHH